MTTRHRAFMSLTRERRPSMLTSLANAAIRRPRRIALAALAFVLFAAVVGGPTVGLLKARDGFQDPSSQSAHAKALIERAAGSEPQAGVLALVNAPVSSPAVASAAATIARVPGVASVATPASGRDRALVSRDGRESIVAATLRSAPYPDDVVTAIQAALHGRHDVMLGGTDVASQEVGDQAKSDLAFAELLAFPLLALLSLLIFRGLAALLPVAVGGTAVLGTFLGLRVINSFLSLSSFSLNLVIGLGLGLAIDYSLLLVWRFREELGQGQSPPDALRTTMATAGRTVCFSAVTVAAALASLIVFPQRFLVSMGLGGAVVALVAAASALLVLPALLILLAGHIGRVVPRPEGTRRWYRLTHAVMRRPALVAVVTAAGLLVIASPVLGIRWSGIDASVLPAGKSARVVSDQLARKFPAQDLNAITIAATAPRTAGPELAAYEARLRTVPGITTVRPPVYLGRGVWELTAGATSDPISAAAQRTVQDVRMLRAPLAVAVGGHAAEFHDQKAAIASTLPVALVLLAVTTLVILWLMTGSVVLPVLSLAMNALTVAAASGLLVFIFQDGRLTGPLSYTSQGGIEQTDFLVFAALVFALSTDYGVLVLTRIKEAWDRRLGAREAVAVGLEHSGRIVTLAAILLAVAIGAFGTSKVVFLKEVGLGTAVAVLIDAFIVRTALVPSLMALLGRRAWWSPAPLRRVHHRVGIGEAPPKQRQTHEPAAVPEAA
jgi:RND superfamily putative drug exporter